MSEYCGITNQNDGTYSSAYGYYLYDNKTYKDLLPQEGDERCPTDTTFDANGLTVNILDLSDIKETGATLSDEDKNNLVPNEQLVIKGAYSWWLKDAVKLVEDTYNVDFNGEKINFGFEYNTESKRGAVTNSEEIRVNMAPERTARNLTEDNLHYDYNPYHLAVVLAHEMTHVAQYNFNMPDYNSDGTPAYIDEGMGDLTVGRFYTEEINALAGNADSLKAALDTFGKINFKISDSLEYKSLEYETGFLFWHYLMKQTLILPTPPAPITPKITASSFSAVRRAQT